MGKREYLKHKGLFEDLPKRLSMRSSAKWGNCNWTPYIYHKSKSSKLRMWYHKIDNFIKSRIGKSYNEVYSEFKKKFPEYCGSTNLVEEFKNHFKEYQISNYNWKDRTYYIDEAGLIQDGYKQRIKPKTAKINIRSKIIEYSFSDYVFNDTRLLNIIFTYLPGNYYQYLIQGVTFSKKIHDSIKFYLTKDNVLKEVSPLYSYLWFVNKGQYSCFDFKHKWTGSDYTEIDRCINSKGIELLIFKEHIIEDCDIVDIKSKAFRRSIEDTLKIKNSIRRNENKQKELEREFLLHDLLQTRKKKEKEKNDLIRDRHGFDDHSFKNW